MTKVIEAVRQLRGEAHPRGSGEGLPPGIGHRHGRLDGKPPWQRRSDSGEGRMSEQTPRVPTCPETQRREQGVLECRLGRPPCSSSIASTAGSTTSIPERSVRTASATGPSGAKAPAAEQSIHSA
jgi:hypothetical protein